MELEWSPLVIGEPNVVVKFHALKYSSSHDKDADFLMALLELYEIQNGVEDTSFEKESLAVSIKVEPESQQCLSGNYVVEEINHFKNEVKSADLKSEMDKISITNSAQSKKPCKVYDMCIFDQSTLKLEEVTKDFVKLPIDLSKVTRRQSDVTVDVQRDESLQGDETPDTKGGRTCMLCAMSFDNFSDLRKHMRNHKGYHLCKYCEELCHLKTNLLKHMDKCLSKGTADTAEKIGSEPQMAQQNDGNGVPGTEVLVELSDCKGEGNSIHVAKCRRINKTTKKFYWYCPICPGLKLAAVKSFRDHFQTDHCDYQLIFKKGSQRITPFTKVIHKCNECVLDFINLRSFKDHNRIRHDNKLTFPCEKCGRTYSDLAKLNNHDRDYHRNCTRYLCDVCGRNCYNATFLREHKATHDELFTKFVCSVCKKLYDTASGLSKHMQTTHADASHTCEICGSKHRYAALLRNHLKSHNKNRTRNFRCSLCEKTFREQYDLDQHMKQHNGIKDYVCEICSKSYRLSQCLQEHLNTHTGERPFKCTICSKAFMHSGALYKHGQLKHKGFKISCKKTQDTTAEIVKGN